MIFAALQAPSGLTLVLEWLVPTPVLHLVQNSLPLIHASELRRAIERTQEDRTLALP